MDYEGNDDWSLVIIGKMEPFKAPKMWRTGNKGN